MILHLMPMTFTIVAILAGVAGNLFGAGVVYGAIRADLRNMRQQLNAHADRMGRSEGRIDDLYRRKQE